VAAARVVDELERPVEAGRDAGPQNRPTAGAACPAAPATVGVTAGNTLGDTPQDRPVNQVCHPRSRGSRSTAVFVRLGIALVAVLVTGSAANGAPAGVSSAVGAYRLAGGDLVSLVVSEGRLRLVDYGSGAMRSLRRVAEGLYVGGPGVSIPSPVRVRVRLEAGGGVRVDGRAGRRLSLVSQPVVFADGPVRLAGRLLRPPGRGPFPGVVIVPGSEPAHRTTYDLWAYFFAAHGFAVLSYDKRGVGDSSGTYVRAAAPANLRDLASDALTGVQWLRRQSFVDGRRVGLDGGSQAGWVIEIAAARSSAVRFATLQSAPAMSVGRQLAYDALTRQGWTDPPPSGAQIAAALARVTDSGFDPRVALASMRIPVLWQLGSVDKRMYTPETVTDLRRITADGHQRFTVRVYAGGAHSLRLTRDGLIRQERTSPGFVPGVFGDLASWLCSRLGAC
jgi:dienelactone hydrolase